jgi:hypothetical protein
VPAAGRREPAQSRWACGVTRCGAADREAAARWTCGRTTLGAFAPAGVVAFFSDAGSALVPRSTSGVIDPAGLVCA